MTPRWLAPFALFLLGGAPIFLDASTAAAQTPLASEAIDSEAHGLFQAGRSAYNDDRYEDALGYFLRAYELSHRPELLYNIAQCQEHLQNVAEAIAAYEGFLAELPDSPQRAEVEGRLEILRASAPPAEDDATDTVPPDTADTTDSDTSAVASSGSDPAPWIVLGAGGAVAIVGAILLGLGYAAIATVDGARDVPFSSVSGAYNDAPVLTGAGWGALGVGVALAGVGLVWGLSGGGGGSEQVRLRLGPTDIAVSGSF